MDAYQVLERIGEGSFGKVYKGRRKFTAQFVALKFIPKVGRSDAELEDIRAEVHILRGLSHPNIILLLDFFETSRELVLVTEYGQGQLYDVFCEDGRRMPLPLVRDIARQLCSALEYLHSKRIVHRDVKPQNVLITSGGVVKLCDFGFARAVVSERALMTSLKGSPLAMAPELFADQRYDASADKWALAVMLYELAAGVPPFVADSLPALMRQVLWVTGEGGPGIAYPPTFTPQLTDFLASILVREPAKRASWAKLLSHPFLTAS